MTDLRKIILRVLLGSLAAAAVMGVLAVMLPVRDVMWRAMFSAFATALAAGIMLPLSTQVDRAKFRASAVAGVAFVVVEFILALGSIWLFDQRSLIGNVGEQLAITMVMLVPPGLVAVLLLRLIGDSRHRAAVLVGVGSMVLSTVLFFIATWMQRWGGDDWWMTGWICYFYGLIAAGCLINLRPARMFAWAWLGVLLSVAAALMAIGGIWWSVSDPSRLFFWLTFAAIVFAYINLLRQGTLIGPQRWLRYGAIGAAVTAGLVMSIGVANDVRNPPETLLRIGAAFTIMAACGGLAMLVLSRLNRRAELNPQYETRAALTLICPRCEQKQNMAAGDHACSKCGMLFRILVQEPHCPHCNYTLYGPKIERCPECGEHVGPLELARCSDADAH